MNIPVENMMVKFAGQNQNEESMSSRNAVEPFEEDHSNINADRKRDRRTKDDECDRHYSCGCGKNYLSYAALYTHTKMKHEGIMQKGSQTASKRRQGRPKKDDLVPTLANPLTQKLQEFNKEFKFFLGMIPGAIHEGEETLKDVLSNFPKDLFVNEDVYAKIWTDLEEIVGELETTLGGEYNTRLESNLMDFLSNRSFNCNKIFALFLVYANRFVSNVFFGELVFFVVVYQKMMNVYGWNKLREMNLGGLVNENGLFCDSQNGEYLPDFSNVFLVQYLSPMLLGEEVLKSVKSLQFFGTESLKLLRIILLTKQFCNWLSVMRFTKAKIEILKE